MLFRRCRTGGSLQIAAMRGDVALVRKLLLEGAQVRHPDAFCHRTSTHMRSRTPIPLLQHSSHYSNIQNSFQPDAKDEDEHTALHHAARNGRFLVVDELLTIISQHYSSKLQALVHDALPDGRNALHLACSKDSVSCAIVSSGRGCFSFHCA